jgi:lysophospholipase L1-like esterase
MKARIILFIIANGAILIAITVAGFNLLRASYVQSNLQRLDPLNLSHYSTDVLPSTSGAIRLVMFGDSRAASWPDPIVDRIEVVNRGIGAQSAAWVALRFPYHVTPLQPDLILVQVCINDLKVIPLVPEQYQSIVEGCIGNIRQMIDAARSIQARVILTTVFPVGNVPIERQLFWSDAVAQAVRDVNTQLITFAADDVILFDAYTLLAGDDGLIQSEYAEDELHLNATGYAVLNDALVPLFNDIANAA